MVDMNTNDVIDLDNDILLSEQKSCIESLKKKIAKIEIQNDSLTRYNTELLEQNQLFNAKFHLAKQFLYRTVSTQTDSEDDCTNVIVKSDPGEKSRKRIHSELNEFLQCIQSNATDYVYDSNTNTYYSRSTGWYYYPDSSSFYNTHDQCYYSYDSKTKQYNFLYKLDQQKKTKTVDKRKKKEIIVVHSDCECSEKEEGEIDDNISDSKIETEVIDSSDDDGEIVDITEPKLNLQNGHQSNNVIESKPLLRNQMTNNHSKSSESGWIKINSIAPVRLIVQKSTTLDIGSLLLITCMGGKLGQHSNCTVTIPDSTISQLHAEISFDFQRSIYTIQDLISRNGTFVNDVKLNGLERTPLFHGDIIRLSDCQLLAHIHQHRDVTCSDCEPGNLITVASDNEPVYSTTIDHRTGLKNLKKKYGFVNSNDGENSSLPQGYRDRAAERQRVVGSDNPYEKTAAGSALDLPLDEHNKGFQMLSKMGWKTGHGLGKQEDSVIDPIDIEVRDNRHGLGFKH